MKTIQQNTVNTIMTLLFRTATGLFFCLLFMGVFNLDAFSADDKTSLQHVKTVHIRGLGKTTIKSLLRKIAAAEDSNSNESKGVLGEIAAIALFKTQAYEILENQAHQLIGCELTSKRGKAGIDGIFRREGYVSIFNEAKYRKKGCNNSDLPYATYGQEMSPKWVSYHFAHLRENDMTRSPICDAIDFNELEQQYKEGYVLRTLTCLRETGNVDLYYFNDVNYELNQRARAFLANFPDLDKSDLVEEVNEQLRRRNL